MIRPLLLLVTLASSSAQEPLAVRTVAPGRADQAARYEVPGRTEALESATIFTRATGIVSERRFDIGDSVRADEVIALIAAPEVDRAVEAARASVEQAKATAANARNLSERSRRLRKSDVVSTEETEQRLTEAATAQAAVRVAEAELARLEEQQRFSVVRAPFDGVISARNVDRGDLARGDASGADGWMYRLDRLDTLRFVIGATPDLALRLARDGEVRVRFGEFPGREFHARVSRSSRVFDPDSGTMRVELLLENKDLAVPAGLTGTAVFQLVPPPGTFTVPTNALVSREGKAMLALVEAGKARFVEVAPGKNRGAQVEVTSAQLTDNASVILNPNAMLKPGDPVAVAPPDGGK